MININISIVIITIIIGIISRSIMSIIMINSISSSNNMIVYPRRVTTLGDGAVRLLAVRRGVICAAALLQG